MSNNTLMFPGSGDVFVSYHDIIGTPKFSVLVELIQGHLVPGVYNTYFFELMSVSEVIQWYMSRHHDNFLNDPQINQCGFTKEQNDRMLQELLAKVSYTTFAPVNLMTALMLHPIVDNLHIYTKEQENGAVGATQLFINSVKNVDYRYGDIKDIIRSATDHCTMITTSTSDARSFLDSKYEHRYVSLIFPNNYDDIRNISDIYSQYGDRITIIDIRHRIKQWEESL